jgi:hypothetical protein
MEKRHIPQIILYTALTLTFLIGTVLPSRAQTTATAHRSAPMYDPATEITVKGTVEAVNQLKGARGWAGTHLPLKTEKETLDVHIGRSWFLTKNGVSFSKGDLVEVVGSKVKFGETDALLAREITKGDKKLVLRNEKGFPTWSRRPRS